MSTPDLVTPYGVPMFVERYVSLDTGPSAWLIDGLIPQSGSTLLFGAPKTGKSNLALQMALAVTQGQRNFFGFRVVQSGRVLYLQLDTPRSLWIERIKNWESVGVDFTPHGSLAFEDSLSAPYPFNIMNPNHASWLAQAVAIIDPVLVVVDVWRECFRGDENDSYRGQVALSTLKFACRPAALLIVSHGKKPPQDPTSQYGIMDEARGSSYLPGAVDTVARLRCRENDTRGLLDIQGRATPYQAIGLQRGDAGLWSLAGGGK